MSSALSAVAWPDASNDPATDWAWPDGARQCVHRLVGQEARIVAEPHLVEVLVRVAHEPADVGHGIVDDLSLHRGRRLRRR